MNGRSRSPSNSDIQSSDYGTERNSLKAFSLLVFVGTHLPAVLEHAGDSSLSEEDHDGE
jgi:type IV secretory pathway VirB10-like protein